MATGSVSKVRLVKCPECMRLLPEEEGLAIYKCGGCGTFLQAKICRKPDVHSSEQDNVSQGQGSSSTTRNQTLDETLKNNLIVPDTDQLDAINIPEEVRSAETGSNLGNSGPSGNSPKGDEPAIEDDASGLGAFPSHQPVEEFRRSTVIELDRVTPIDTEQFHPRTELADTTHSIVKSPSAGTANAYDGSNSSCDGIDNQVLKSHSNRYKSTLGDEELVRAREILRKGKFPINSNNQYSKKCNMRDPNEPSRGEHRKKEEDREKLKLLRRVYELQNQLDKAHFAGEKAKQNSKHCNLEPCFDERDQDLNCPSQSRFSGEVINRRRQVDHSCLHCCPHHCLCRVHCHPTNCCCNGPCCVHHHHNLCGVHCSRPRSDKKTDKERYTNTGYHSQNLHARSNQHFVKQHFRPIAGGAPFVTCYHCLNPLQLPDDYPLHKMKCYQLKCGSCSKNLKFSLQSNNHIIPEAPCGVHETGRPARRSSTSVPMEAREKRVLFGHYPYG